MTFTHGSRSSWAQMTLSHNQIRLEVDNSWDDDASPGWMLTLELLGGADVAEFYGKPLSRSIKPDAVCQVTGQ